MSALLQIVKLTERIAEVACAPCTTHACCNSCQFHGGYFRTRGSYVLPIGSTGKEEITSRQLAALKHRYGWTEEAGFRGPSGCKLPRIKRSAICLSHLCWWGARPRAEHLDLPAQGDTYRAVLRAKGADDV